MPAYKYLGNRILTRIENGLLNTSLTEFHSGYRAYRVSALAELLIENNTDAFDFDTQIIVQLIDAGKRIVEIPIPTYYGDEICYVNGVRYAKDVVKDVLQYRLAQKGFGTCPWIPKPEEYAFKEGDGSSHAAILEMLQGVPPSRILDLGCSGGLFAERVRALGHEVTGVDYIEVEGVRERTDRFLLADLNNGLPDDVGDGYDLVVAGDVIEHLHRPERVLEEIRTVLRPGGELLLSVPNIGHWYSRGRVALGGFDYDRRGILDETHLRFYSRASLRRAMRTAGYDLLGLSFTGSPFVNFAGEDSVVTRIAGGVSKALVKARPTLFGYQLVARLTPHAERILTVGDGDHVEELLLHQSARAGSGSIHGAAG
ncbi:bifunctional glycosyltransferase/class I SAM-dependent methyltransferase [Streptacidiphilus jeojiense]|nr:bifunctional glycosyltransferase/class I SAM-dependent methyltransferase [Streptacidiphilus jeojiense]